MQNDSVLKWPSDSTPSDYASSNNDREELNSRRLIRPRLMVRLCTLVTLLLAGCSFYPSNKSVGLPFCAAGEGEIYELAVYRIATADSEQLLAARRDLRTALGRYSGFRCALPLTGLDDSALSVDLIVWRSVDDARAAAQNFPNDSKLSPLYGTERNTALAGFFSEIPKVAR